MDIVGLLTENKKKMDERIFAHLPSAHDNPDIKVLYDMMLDYPGRKGKGIRGSLCLLSCGMLGGNPDRCLDTAAAIEVFESWVLIHDDIEDGSEMRRGGLTLHRKHSVPLAINAGDALANRMWGVLVANTEKLGWETTYKILQEFLHMINQTTEGQHIELSWNGGMSFDLNEDDYYSMCVKKTAWYTCISPLRLGGIIAGAPEQLLASIIAVGTDMGLAFQIQDDVLNLTGDEKKYGKEIYGDIREGKRTLALIHALENCIPKDKAKLKEIVGKDRERISDGDVSLAVKIMKDSGSVEFARAKARQFAQSAKEKFDRVFSTVPDSEEKRRIREIIDFVVSREK
jgi:geranylgeranyl diphosphate synthase type II